MFGSWRVGIALWGAAALLGAGCGSGEDGDGGGAVATIQSFAASSESIDWGTEVTLSWKTKGATSLSLSAGGFLVDLGDAGVKEGEIAFTLERTTTYRLDAFGSDGKVVSSVLTVEVAPPGPPRIERFVSSSETVAAGEAFTLSWEIFGASSIQIVAGGSALKLGKDTSTSSGSVETQILGDTTFTLVATGAGGESQENVQVAVSQRPVLQLLAEPNLVDAGETVTLSWSSLRADEVVIRDGDGTVVRTTSDASGSMAIPVMKRTEFQGEATGAGGETVAMAKVEVRPIIELFAAEIHGEVRPGHDATITWKTLGAEELILSNGGDLRVVLSEAEGTIAAPVATGGGFQLLARSGSQITQALAVVRTTELPVVRSLQTGEPITAGLGQFGSTEVEWLVDGASRIRLEVDPGGWIDTTDKSTRSDRVIVPLTDVGTIRLFAANASGETEFSIPSPVKRTPSVGTFRALPSRVGSGETVDIIWETNDAETITLSRDGVQLPVAPGLVDGRYSELLPSSATYELILTNPLGFQTSQELVVEMGSPNIVAFDTAGSVRRVPTGGTLDFLWQNDGGVSLELIDETNGVTVCQTQDREEILSGGCTINTPVVQAPVHYTLQVMNGSGMDRETIEVQIVTGPIIVDLLVEQDQITEGDRLLFSWFVDNDANGVTPVLTLVDHEGTVFDIAGLDANQGSARFAVSTVGTTTFTLTATTPGTPAASRDVQFMVFGIPTVDQLGSTPGFAAAEEDPITVSWQTTHGASVEVFRVDRSGNVSGDPIYSSANPADATSGSTTVAPTIAIPDVRLVVKNPLGVPTAKHLRVGVNPASVTSLTASSTDLLVGEELTLSWVTERADKAVLNPFFDLTQRPTATDLGLQNQGTTATPVKIPFPPGFAFPYSGEVFTEATVTIDGYLSFDPTVTAVCCNVVLPPTAAANRKIHIMPFWDHLHTNLNGTSGTILWEYLETPNPHLIIQWSHMNLALTGTTYQPSDLNFQLILYKDGSFEFRYGEMTSPSPHAAGGGANIATLELQGFEANVLLYNTAMEDGLSGRTFYFDSWDVFSQAKTPAFPLPLTGSWTFTPAAGRTYSLHASNGHSEHLESVTVNVHEPATLTTWTVPEVPAPGQQVWLHWAGTNLTALEIEDGAGIVTLAGSDLQGGSLDLGVLPEGTYPHEFRGVGQISRDQVVVNADVHVYDPFSLDSFTASAERIKHGESVSLIWTGTNGDAVQIEAIPGGPVSIPGTVLPNDGMVSHQPQETTTYVLSFGSQGRIQTAEVVVEVRSVYLDNLQLSRTEVPLGDSVDFTWTPGGVGGTVTIEPDWAQYVMRDVTAASPYSSISSVGTPIPPVGTSASTYRYPVTFPAGFSFPFFGEEVTQGVANADGYFNLDSGQTASTSADFNMPRPNTVYPSGVFGLFWMDLTPSTTGIVYEAYVQVPGNPQQDHMILEWKNFQFVSTTYNGPAPGVGNLNFQLVLYRDGSFEYRYGDMVSVSTNPQSAKGAFAMAGFQDGPGERGYTLFLDDEMPGGLSGRSWRWDLPATVAAGSMDFGPDRSGYYRICVENDTWRECDERFLTVFQPGDIVISELMINPAASADDQWFEIRNLAPGPFDLEGKTIRMGANSHTINSGASLVIPAGGYAVLAKTNLSDVSPDYVYGPLMNLASPAGSVSIEWDGMLMGETAWTSAWTTTSGVSLELRGHEQRPREPSRTAFASYCASGVAIGTGPSFGTPGTGGGSCGVKDGYVVDFASPMPFIDITETGNLVPSLRTTTTSYAIPGGLGFSMPFFGDVVTDVWVNSNGLIGLTGTPSTTATNRAMGTGTTVKQGLVAPFWETLIVVDGDSGFYWEERTIMGSRVMVLQWNRYRYNVTTFLGSLTFQAQLWENGDIAIVYGEIEGMYKYYRGSSATVGIESISGAQWIQYLHLEQLARPHQSLFFQKL